MRGFDAWTLELTAWARTLPLHLPTLQPEATILHLESHFPCLYKAGYLRCPSWSGERVEAAGEVGERKEEGSLGGTAFNQGGS